MKIDQRKIIAFLFVALCVNSYSKNLDTPNIYDSTKMKISDWKLNETEKYLNRDGNLDKLLAQETGLPVIVADEPLTCVTRGGGKVLEFFDNPNHDMLFVG